MSLLSRLAVQAARAYGILSSADKTKVVADYLVVAGGGGGNNDSSGGGGAGGFQTSTFTLSTLNTYSIAVGAGGAYTTNGANSAVSGTGLTTVTSIGGGRAGGSSGGYSGASGGSGGGGSGGSSPNAGGAGTSGQGNAGGNGNSSSPFTGGGGGGASAAGSAGGANGGNGGAGTASSISGSSVTYAGGGGGNGGLGSAGTGGAGGGGNGGSAANQATATSGTANTGGGAGGGNSTYQTSGGSGIVIISYTSATPKFVGGTITTSGGKQIHTFTSSGTLSPITPITASYLVVAGGGGGGRQYGGQGAAGGGGAGGLLTSSTTLYSGATYVVTVGAGGAGGSSAGAAPSGSDSVVSGTGLTTLTATGGGGGAGSSGSGASGGSGGGGQGEAAPKTGGSGTSGQGNAGGSGVNAGGGGGGASSAGSSAVTVVGGAGGNGTASSISGTSVTYAGGGGGGGYTGAAGAGGTGGGGSGQTGTSTTPAVSGTANLGGGGGGAGYVATGNYNGAAGGSGIVIISYAGSQAFNGGLVTSSGGNTIHTFTSTGALTPLTNNLNNSLRFRSSASAYLNRTFTSVGNRRTWTWSSWVKRGGLTTEQTLFTCWNSPDVYTAIRFLPGNSLYINQDNGAGNVWILQTSSLYRDPSAWYHIVVAFDTTQATAANRVKIYVNGNQVTAFSTETYPSQNSDTQINRAQSHTISQLSTGSYIDGYLADINFIDGQALEPYFFGNNDANGVWKPIQYKGTYGTNGFYLTFGNTTSTTTLGYDSSPNGNNWTCNNISLTAGTTYDAMTDVPTNTSATVANYAVLDPLDPTTSGNMTLSNANLTMTTSAANRSRLSTIYVPSGKWYAEVTFTTASGSLSGCMVGLCRSEDATSVVASYLGSSTNSYGYNQGGDKYNAGSATAYGASYTTSDIIGIAFDADAGTVTFYKNNTSQGTAFTGLSTSSLWSIGVSSGISSTSQNIVSNINFGQRPFSYTPPTGFNRVNTYNL